MDYKEKYEQALERSKDFIERQNPPSLDRNIMSNIFPELKPVGDKDMMEALENILLAADTVATREIYGVYGRTREDLIDWVKGLKKSNDMRTRVFHSYRGPRVYMDDSCLEFQPSEFIPKFKVGDVVTNGEHTYTIDKISSDCYWVKEHDCVTIPFDHESMWNLLGVDSTNKSIPEYSKWSVEDWKHYHDLETFLEAEGHYTENSSGYQKKVHDTLEWLRSFSPNYKYQNDIAEKEKQDFVPQEEWVSDLKRANLVYQMAMNGNMVIEARNLVRSGLEKANIWDLAVDTIKPMNHNNDTEKEKSDFVSGKFLYCRGSILDFKEGETYWLEYIGDDTYVGRSDNVLNQKFRITPRLLYTWFTDHIPCWTKDENANPQNEPENQKTETITSKIASDEETDIQKARREGRNDGIEMVINNPEEYGLQKRCEWSKDDDWMLLVCYNAIDAYASEVDKVRVKQWLKSLKHQQRWKPTKQNIEDLEWCANVIEDKIGAKFHRLQVLIDELKEL